MGVEMGCIQFLFQTFVSFLIFTYTAFGINIVLLPLLQSGWFKNLTLAAG